MANDAEYGYKMSLIFLFIYTRIKFAYPLYSVSVGVRMGITLQHPVGIDICMSINFENKYGWGYD